MQAAIVSEEGGEVLQAGLNLRHAEDDFRYVSLNDQDRSELAHLEEELVKEVIHTGAMVLRFLLAYNPRYETRPESID